MRRGCADETRPLATVKAKNAFFEDFLASAPSRIDLSKEHPGQQEKKLPCPGCSLFVVCGDKLPEGDALRSDVVSANDVRDVDEGDDARLELLDEIDFVELRPNFREERTGATLGWEARLLARGPQRAWL